MFSRRSILGGLGGVMVAPHAARAMNVTGRPPRLQRGDVVGLIEPAGFSDGPEQVEAVKAVIVAMGLVPRVGAHVGARYGYLAGTDAQRASDINAMYRDDAVRAIFAIRGGWGCARLLPLLDWEVIRSNPKVLIGFSDITALHLAFAARTGFPTLHAPNAANSWQAITWDSLWRLVFSGEAPELRLAPSVAPFLPSDDGKGDSGLVTIRSGKARGRLVGGNLSVLSTLMGTPWLPDFDNAILFLEEVNEAEYRIDRMLNQLALSGILGKLAGVIVGQCTRCASGVPGYLGFTVPQLLDQYLSPLGIPVVHGANIGHVGNQLCMPSGARVELDAGAGTLRLLDPIVA